MKTTFKVWQLCNDKNCKLEHPIGTIEVADGECPVCSFIGRPPPHAREGQASLMAFVQVDKPMQVQVRDVCVVKLKPGLTMSAKYGFFAYVTETEMGVACEKPTAKMWKEHGF